MIACRSLHVAYGTGQPDVLCGLSFTVPSGSICALLGPTGAGKSTLLHALSGTLGMFHHAAQCSGSVTVNEETFMPVPRRVLFPAVGMLMQEPHLQFSGMAETVEGELKWTLDNLGIIGDAAQKQISVALDRFGCSTLRARTLRSLSGGELHRIAFASVLVARPSVLLLDEPVASLDQNARAQVARLLDSLRGDATILFTDSDPDLAMRLADRIIVLDSGTLRLDGSRKTFLDTVDAFGDILTVTTWPRVRERFAASGLSSLTARRLRRSLGQT